MDPADLSENPFASPQADLTAAQQLDAPTNAEAIRQRYLSREATIKSLGTLYYIAAVLWTIGLASLIAGSVFGLAQDGWAGGIGLLEVLILLIVVFLTAGCWWIAPALRRLRPWAQGWTLGLSIVFLVLSLIGFNILFIIINAVALWAVSGRTASFVFSEEYKEVIKATPHIRYKTHPLVWGILLFLLLLIAGIVGFALLSSR